MSVKKIIIMGVTIIIALYYFGITNKSNAAETVDICDVSENKDKSIIATIDKKKGTLTISGSGKIKEEGFESDYFWYGMRGIIRKIYISDKIENIPKRAFVSCSSLIEINLGKDIKSIGYEAFSDCSLLKNIELPEGLEFIDRKAFELCRNLINISIPNTVKMIGQEDNILFSDYYLSDYQFDVFRYCENLETILVGENNTSYSSVEGVLFNKDKTKLICYPQGKKTSEYTLPSSVITIGAYSMYNAVSIKQINFNNKLKKISDGAFVGCSNIENINIPENFEMLGCEVFVDCKKIKNVTVDEKNSNFSATNGVLFDKDKTVIIYYPVAKDNKSYTIPNSVISISMDAFRDCSKLTNIEIPNSVVNIGSDAFWGCTGLTNIVIPESVKNMGSTMLKKGFSNIFYNCENLKSIKLPTYIDTFYTMYCFYKCKNLEEVIMPEGVDYIDMSCFEGCFNLSNIKLPQSLKFINASAFDCCYSLKKIDIPCNISSLISSFNQTGLEIIDIPDSITTIDDSFRGCKNLKEIHIPNTVTNIREGSFDYSKLTIKVETNENESYKIELPELIKRTFKVDDILYSENGLYNYGCILNENNIIADKEMLENRKVLLKVRSGALKGLTIEFESISYSDINPPVIKDISSINGPGVLKQGTKVYIKVRCVEPIKGDPPKLKIKFGNSEERLVSGKVGRNSSETDIDYTYTVKYGDNGLLEVISLEGGKITDWSGNELLKNNIPKFETNLLANTLEIEPDFIKEEYHIKNKEDLINIKEIINSGTYDFYYSTIYLENDINLEGSEDNQWEPIGTNYSTFSGVFDGKGHEIKGMYIDSEENYQGFFGANSGTIKNLFIVDGYISSTGNYIGGITGCNCSKAIIEKCYNSSSVKGNKYVGGIVGYTWSVGCMENCYNSGNISGTENIGGIAGRIYGDVKIINCYNSGNISGTEDIGGIAGGIYGDVKIINCYNSGNLFGRKLMGGIGGAVFCDNINISNCYNIGKIHGDNGYFYYTGTIVGKVSSKNINIKNCYYLNAQHIKAINDKDDEENNVYGLDEDYMKSEKFVDLLNSGNTDIIWKGGKDNYQYPVLTTLNDIEESFPQKMLIEIIIKNNAQKTTYIEGQDFESAGMKIEAIYNNGTTEEVSNYQVTNGRNLKLRQTGVTISYTEDGVTKTVEQGITVNKKGLTSIKVKQEPNKKIYIEGQNFESTGMKIEAIYNNGTTEEVSNYQVTNGRNLKLGQTGVTISYTENGVTKTIEQPITVIKKETLNIEVKNYEVKKENGTEYIEKIMPNTSIETLIRSIVTNGIVEIYKEKVKTTDENQFVGTGMEIIIKLDNEEKRYTVVVTGDLTGNGKMGIGDLSKLSRYTAGLDKTLSGAYLKAADILENGKYGGIANISKMSRILAGMDNL